MKANSNTQTMGTEKIPKLLAQLAIPAVVAQVVNLLYNIVDRIYIGHISGIGASALTGVGLFTPILMLLNAFAMLAGNLAICSGICKNLYSGKCVCTGGTGNESVYYYSGIRKDQYADYRDWCSYQHFFGSGIYLCI